MPIAMIPFEQFELDNGLTVIVHEDHKAPVVAVSIWYHVGSADEPAGKTGFAHLFEHLMFSGSEHHRDVFFKPFERVGATDQNGTTSFDRTNYFETVPTTALDLALWMESDRMGHLLGALGEAELDTQRGVVKNEKRQNENKPYGRVFENILLNAFPANHPYQHTTIGSMDDLDAVTLGDAHGWFRAYYGAANTTLVLAGDITPAIAREKARRYFGDIPAGSAVPRQQPWIAARHASTRGMQVDNVPQSRILREWNIPALGDADVPLLQLAARVLGGGVTSRLYRRLVSRDKLADELSVDVLAFALAGLALLTVDVRNGVEPAVLEAAIAEEWWAFLQSGPTEDELARARIGVQGDFIRGLEKVGGFRGKAVVLAEGQLYRNDPAAYRSDLARIESATPEDVLAAARRWLAQGDYTLTVVPATSSQEHGENMAAGLPANCGKPAPVMSAAKPDARTESGIDRRAGPPSVANFPEANFPAPQRATLRNGIEVVLAERHTIPVVQVCMQFDAGFSADHGRKPGLANFVASMLDEGTYSLDAVEIALRCQRLGTHIAARADLDMAGVTLNALDAELEPSMELFADMVRNPAFRPDDVERIRAQVLARIRQESNDPAALGPRLLPPLLYGATHAYGTPFSGLGTEPSVASLDGADLLAFHREFYRPDRATIFVAGSATLERIVPLLDRMFGGWPSPASPPPARHLATVTASTSPRVFLVHRADAPQSQIFAGALAPSTCSADHLALQLANAILCGMFTSRLNLNLREDKHWSYGARSVFPDALGQRPLMISAPVQTDRTADAIAEILREVREVRDTRDSRPPTSDEVEKAKAQRIRILPGSFETTESVLNVLVGNQLFGRSDDYVVRLKRDIQTQTPERVAAAARALFVPDALTWLVIGDLARIEPSVRALGIGEVHVLDIAGHTA